MTRVVILVITLYALLVGANVFAIIRPDVSRVSLVVLGLSALLWAIARRGGWRWHRTSLDPFIPVWAVAFAVSLLANAESWRRIGIALWYMGLYVAVWYAVHDGIANRGLPRRQLLNALLVVGLVEMILGIVQFRAALAAQLPAIRAGQLAIEPLRPYALLGNANIYATFVALLLPLAIGRLLTEPIRLARWTMALYTLLAAFLLFVTFSRGAWLAAAFGIVTELGLYLHWRGRLGRGYWRGWWAQQPASARRWAAFGVAAAVVLLVAGAVIFLWMFTVGGRTADWRTRIWLPAFVIFKERPITGYGLFTFGANLPRYLSMPPGQVQEHAHNIVLNVGAELGWIGLIALVATIIAVLRSMRANWQRATSHERATLLGAVGAACAFGINHLVDMTSLNPSIALSGLLVIVAASAPVRPALLSGARARLQSWLLAALWLALVGTGVWNNLLDQRYVDTLGYAVASGDYADAADRLQTLVNADPSLPLYHAEQGLLYGMAAAQGDTDAARLAIDAYAGFVSIERNYANAWANLASLYWQIDDRDRALAAMRRAVELAPADPALAYRLGVYEESTGNAAEARAMYNRALQLAPGLQTTTFWGESPIQREMADLEASPASAQEIRSVDDLASASDASPLLQVDYLEGTSILVHGYLRQALPRQFLPQVGYFVVGLPR